MEDRLKLYFESHKKLDLFSQSDIILKEKTSLQLSIIKTQFRYFETPNFYWSGLKYFKLSFETKHFLRISVENFTMYRLVEK